MIDFHIYCQIRELHCRQHLSYKAIAENLHLDLRTISKWAKVQRYAPRKGQLRTSVLDPYKPAIAQEIALSQCSASVVFRGLTQDGYTGGLTIVKDFVHRLRIPTGKRISLLPVQWMLKLLQGKISPRDLVANNGDKLSLADAETLVERICEGLIMSIALRDALARLTVPELKDLVSHLPGAETAGRKDELIERIVAGMLGPGSKAIWSGLDETQQGAVAEAVYDPLGEYSEQRFRAKYQRVPSFQVAGAKSHGYSGNKISALGLFIHYVRDERCHLIPADLRNCLQALVPQPAPLSLESSETLADDAGLTMRLTEREALQEVVVMLRTIEQARIQVSEKTALPGTAALRFLIEKLAGGDFYPWVEKKNKWDQEIGPIKAFAWPMLLQAGGLAVRAGESFVRYRERLRYRRITGLSGKPRRNNAARAGRVLYPPVRA